LDSEEEFGFMELVTVLMNVRNWFLQLSINEIPLLGYPKRQCSVTPDSVHKTVATLFA
jgi:hypothetical protein